MNFWEYIYAGIILYCLPLLLLAISLRINRDGKFVRRLPTWWQVIAGLGVLQLVLLSVMGVVPLLIMPFGLLCSIGAPISAGIIGSLAVTLSYTAVVFAMFPPNRV